MIIVYDGTFESFLTLIYEVYYKKLQITQIKKELPETLFLDDIYKIIPDETKSLKVLQALQNRFEKKHLQTILNIFMCDGAAFEMDLLHFIILGFKDQKELFNINNSCVFHIENIQKELFRLNHIMSGFVRFEELEDQTLYAKIETKFNIVYFLGKHFLKRLNNQNFIIHDIERKLAFIKNNSFQGIQNIASFDIPKHSKDEQKFQKLWKTFFQSVSIESRKNTKLQQQWIPLIYRVYMTEFQ
jgi:probable DNA metabolism protein